MGKQNERLQEAVEFLKTYSGDNTYLLLYKHRVASNGPSSLSDYAISFILNNKTTETRLINRTIGVAEWFGEERQKKWLTDFVPKKLRIVEYYGETDRYYHCCVQYRQSVEPVLCVIPKNAVLKNFLHEDYTQVKVDFDRYDRLSSAVEEGRVLKEHQKEAIQFLLSRKKCILADSMGLGKTTSLTVASIEGNYDSILIICPASIKTNWKNELKYYVPEKDITIIHSINDKTKGELETFLGYAEGRSGKKKEELIEEAKTKGKWQDNKYVIINYDILDEFFTLSRATSEAGKKKILEQSPLLKFIYNRKSCIIIDEAHKLSNNTSTRYKIINQLIKRGNPDSIFLSTGTPILNNPQNLYYLLRLIENEVSADMNYYRERYCDAKTIYMKGEYEKWRDIWYKRNNKVYGNKLTDNEWNDLREFINNHARKATVANGANNLDELKERISHIYLRRVKEDMGTLPKKIVHELYYDLTSMQQAEYDKLWDEYEEAQLNENIDKELNKELLEGGIYRRYLSNIMVEHTQNLCDKILETEDKVIIACCYDEELNTLKEHYGDSAVVYNGKKSLKQKDKAIEEFTNNPEIKVFIGNIIAAGVGINLTRCKSLVYNNISYVAADNLQMEDRIYRLTQTRDVDIYYQIFNDTQYQHMWDIVLRKQMIADAVIKKEGEK